MKRVLSAVLAMVLLCAMACVGVSADPVMYMADSFSGAELDPANWVTDPGANAFYVDNGWCVGDHHAVVLQSMYGPEEGSGIISKEWNYVSGSVDIRFDDFSVEYSDDTYYAAIWWRDYQLQEGAEYYPGDEITTGTVYELRVYPVLRKVDLHAEFGSLLPETTTVEGQTVEEVETSAVVATYTFPEDYEIAVDFSNPGICNLGIRVEENRIRGYLDGEQIIDYATSATICNMRPSPFLLLNHGLMLGFDNVQVASVDYPLFKADTEPQTTVPTPSDTTPTDNTQAPPTEIVTETEIVSSVDKDGNVVTSVVVNTEVVTVPVANTNPTPSVGGNSTATGDMAFIVVAVMIVALGTAVVVKKVNVK